MAVSWIAYDGMLALANKWLSEHHASLVPPTPIEDIVDLRYRIQVIPIEGLHRLTGIDGYLATEQSINIDHDVYFTRENRSRFTMAHELAHIELHWEDVKNDLPRSIEDANRLRQRANAHTEN